MDQRGSAAGVGFVLLLVVLLGVLLFYLYINLASTPTEYEFPLDSFGDRQERQDLALLESKSPQFYQNMRFPDKKITYTISPSCPENKINSAEEAFSIIADRTVLEFEPADSLGQISILCTDVAPEPENEGYFVAGEGGPTEVINTSLYAVIFFGKVSFFRDEKCDRPIIALHEILHVLGFDHNNNDHSVLFPTLDCDQGIDDSIIEDINRLYSVKSAPDLKILSVNASKKGRYLNFEIEIINQGLKDAVNSRLSVFHEDKIVEFDSGDYLSLGTLPVGTKKILTVSNARISINTDYVTFVADPNNDIEEIFEDNNDIRLDLAS